MIEPDVRLITVERAIKMVREHTPGIKAPISFQTLNTPVLLLEIDYTDPEKQALLNAKEEIFKEDILHLINNDKREVTEVFLKGTRKVLGALSASGFIDKAKAAEFEGKLPSVNKRQGYNFSI